MKLVFDIYDFDKDGYISKEDVRLILSYIPRLKDEESKYEKEGVFSQEGGGDDDYNTRITIQEEISQLLDLVFKDKDKINLEEFQSFNEEKASDMLVTVLTLLRDKLPCSETFYKYQREFEKTAKKKSPEEGKRDLKKTKTIASPRILKSLSPLARRAGSGDFAESTDSLSFLHKLAKGEPAKEEDSKGIDEKDIQIDKVKKNRKRQNAEISMKEMSDPESPGGNTEVIRMGNTNPEPKSLLDKNKPKNIFASPTTFLGGSGAEREELESEDSSKLKVEFEGEMMRKAKENKLKKYWHKL